MSPAGTTPGHQMQQQALALSEVCEHTHANMLHAHIHTHTLPLHYLLSSVFVFWFTHSNTPRYLFEKKSSLFSANECAVKKTVRVSAYERVFFCSHTHVFSRKQFLQRTRTDRAFSHFAVSQEDWPVSPLGSLTLGRCTKRNCKRNSVSKNRR